MMIIQGLKYLNAQRKQKYAIMDYYNEHCYPLIDVNRRYKIQKTDSWCATFTSVIAHQNGLTVAQFPYEVSVFYQMQKAKKMGMFYTDVNRIKRNDLIIYDWNNDGSVNHVGIVESVDNGIITVLEGNKHDTVGRRKVGIHNASIEGFISLDLDTAEHALMPEISTNEHIETLVAKTLVGEFGSGIDRLAKLGVNFEEVQKRINRRLD